MTTVHATPSPSYTTLANPFADHADRLSETSSVDMDTNSITSSPPPYTEPTSGTFQPTVHLQIETPGKPLLSLPLPPRPDPIPIFDVSDPSLPRFVSLRPTRGSGSCFLISPSHRAPNGTSEEEAEFVPLSTTQYRFGPGRHPRVRLYTPGSATPTSNPFYRDQPVSTHSPGSNPECINPTEEDVDLSTWDAFELLPVGLLTRAVTFRTRLGTFTWRYATRKERKAVGADSLLVLDRVIRISHALNIPSPSSSSSPASSSRTDGGKKEKEIRTPVAHLIRNGEFRTEGSSPSSAGNGGRLLIDTQLWGDEKVEREMAVVLVVTTCLAMLKKEVDRRRAQQIAIMAGAAGGGP